MGYRCVGAKLLGTVHLPKVNREWLHDFYYFPSRQFKTREEECFQTYLTMKDLYPNCIQANAVVYDKEKKEVNFSLLLADFFLTLTCFFVFKQNDFLIKYSYNQLLQDKFIIRALVSGKIADQCSLVFQTLLNSSLLKIMYCFIAKFFYLTVYT